MVLYLRKIWWKTQCKYIIKKICSYIWLALLRIEYKYPVLFISAATCDLLKEKENDENFFLYDPFRVNEKENGHKIQSYNT